MLVYHVMPSLHRTIIKKAIYRKCIIMFEILMQKGTAVGESGLDRSDCVMVKARGQIGCTVLKYIDICVYLDQTSALKLNS
jgi:hypothetical protein